MPGNNSQVVRYDSDYRANQLQVYRQEAQIPSLTALYNVGGWEDVNRSNVAIKWIQHYDLAPGISNYMDKHADPADINGMNLGEFISWLRDLTIAIADCLPSKAMPNTQRSLCSFLMCDNSCARFAIVFVRKFT